MYQDEEASALWESLARNHPFLDENKSTAFATTFTFLVINGARLTANSDEAFAFISRMHDAGTLTFENLVPWLRTNVTLPDAQTVTKDRANEPRR